MKKLYVTDLDGTLLKNDATLSEFSRQELEKLIKEKNIYFTVASARGRNSIKFILKDFPFNIPIIENNGAYISDYITGEHKIINNIEKEICEDILDMIEEYKCKSYISSFNGKEDKLYYTDIINEGMELLRQTKLKENDKRLSKIDSFHDVVKKDKVVSFTIINKEEVLTPLVDAVVNKYKDSLNYNYEEDQYYKGWHWFTINAYEATKARAIETLKKTLTDEELELVVFGDNLNDIPMFKIGDRSVAVENAKDELKTFATEVIGNNEEDSVVKYILNNEI